MTFSWTAASYIAALVGDAFLIFLLVFHVISFDELKTDFKNPIEHCKTLNPLVLPEYALQLLMTIFFLLCGEWITVLINLPLLAYHIYRLQKSPIRAKLFNIVKIGLYDPTSIMNSDQMSRAIKEGWIKLIFYLFCFFYYIYGLVSSLISIEAL